MIGRDRDFGLPADLEMRVLWEVREEVVSPI